MTIINYNAGDKSFTINGKSYLKIYQPIAVGIESISIYNIYDSKLQILGATPYDEITVNGSVLASQDDLIDELIDGIYESNTGEQGLQGIQGEIAIQGEYISYSTLADAVAVSPKPTDGTLFQVSKTTDEPNAGIYTFNSTEGNGVRFEKPLGVTTEDVEVLDGFINTKVISTNLFDPNNAGIEVGYIVSDTNGNSVADTNYTSSGFIDADGDILYTGDIKNYVTTNVFRKVAFYDSTKSFISGINGWLTSFTTPTNTKYVRFSTYEETNRPNYILENVGLFVGTNPVFETYFNKIIVGLKDSSTNDPKNIATIGDLPNITDAQYAILDGFVVNIETSTNLFNPNTVTLSTYIDENSGNLVSYDSYQTTDFITVLPQQQYTGMRVNYPTATAVFRKIVFFDASKNFISGIDGGNVYNFTTPANTAFVRVSTNQESFSSAWYFGSIGLFEGSDPTWEIYFDPKSIMSLTAGSGSEPDAVITRKDLPTSSVNSGFKVVVNELGETYIEAIIEGKVLKQVLRPFETSKVFDMTDVTYDGALVKKGGDEAAPYRIDGTTIGANHANDTQMFDHLIELYIDDVKITDFNNTTYYPEKTLTVKEYYEIEGINTTGRLAKVSMSYEFDNNGGCTIYTDFLATQDGISLNNIMFTQAICMEGAVSYYVPKTLPFIQDTISYDFSAPYDMTNFAPTNSFMFDYSRCEPTGILPDRLIMLRDDIGFAHGYLPVQDAEPVRRREVVAAYALEIRNNTKKSYPNCIDGSGADTLSNGEYYSAIAYRKYFIPQKSTTASYVINSNKDTYVYLDWHTSTSERIELPTELSGISYEVVEKSDSVTIHSKENTGKMLFDVDTKGYAILKFSR